MKLNRIIALATVALPLATATGVRAQIAAPYIRVFASERGQTLLKVVPDKKSMSAASATLTRFNFDGTEEILWQKPLVNLPGGVLLSNDWNPYLVTTDSWGNAGSTHALVIYNPKGEVVADLKGDDFLPSIVEPPLAAGQPRVMVMDGGGRQWTNNAEISFAPRWDAKTLVVQLFEGAPTPVAFSSDTTEGVIRGTVRKRGKQIRVDLKTGAITRVTPEQLEKEEVAAKTARPVSVIPTRPMW